MTQTANHIDVSAQQAAGRGRRLELAGVLNLRDVGGYPVAGGGTVRWRTLFRSDALHRLDAAGTAALAGLGLQTVLDLRTQAEADAAPSADGLRGRVTHISLLPGDLGDLPARLGAMYERMVDESGPAVAAAVGTLCADGALPALVHCSAGKDRTGIVIALVLAVLGVPDDVIAADYALSGVYLDPVTTPAIGQVAASTGLSAQQTSALLASPPGLIVEVLDRVREQAGSVEDYLTGHGLAPCAVDDLRSALIA